MKPDEAEVETNDNGDRLQRQPFLPFYIIADGDCGLVYVEDEGKDPLTFDAAMDVARQRVEDHGGVQFVVECRCIRRVQRGRLRVETVKQKKAKPHA